jgi:hypothetical protein
MKTLATLALCLSALAAVPAVASAAPKDGARGGRAGRGQRMERVHRAMHRRDRAARLLKAMNLTEEQKTALKTAREAAAPVREDLAAKIQAIREEAKKGERTPQHREAVRAQVKAAVAAAFQAVEPSAQRFVGALSAEQKAELAKRAQAHGKTFDEAKLAKALERMLLAPAGRHGGHGRRAR